MKVPKPTDIDRERFGSFVPDRADVEIKPLFGNLGAFVNRNMFMGLFGSDIGVKLPDADRQQLLAKPGAGPFGPDERPMSGYVTLPADWPAAKAQRWITSAYTAAAALPAKPTKPSTSKRRPA